MLSEFLSPAAGIIYYYLRKPRHGHLSPYVCVCVYVFMCVFVWSTWSQKVFRSYPCPAEGMWFSYLP